MRSEQLPRSYPEEEAEVAGREDQLTAREPPAKAAGWAARQRRAEERPERGPSARAGWEKGLKHHPPREAHSRQA